LGDRGYELETVGGERIKLVYNGYTLTSFYNVIDDLSFSIEAEGLSGIMQYLDAAGFEIAPAAMITVNEEIGDIPIAGV
jgi:hypothetical protein